MTDPIETTIYDLLARRDAGKSICPSEVAKALEPERWQRLMPQVRAVATGLMRDGRLVITKKGKPVDPNSFKGVIRLKLPAAGAGDQPEASQGDGAEA